MKFPRTPHLPGSKSTPDDIHHMLGRDGNLKLKGDYIATEKMDGSNIMMNSSKFITRKGATSSADWTYPARTIQQTIGHLIPKGVWLAGELVTWRKGIAYDALPGDYIIFGAIKGNDVLAWDDVLEIAANCGLPTVNVLAGPDTADNVFKKSLSLMNESIEGFVIRPTANFQLPHYANHVAKYVGAHHVGVATANGRNNLAQI